MSFVCLKCIQIKTCRWHNLWMKASLNMCWYVWVVQWCDVSVSKIKLDIPWFKHIHIFKQSLLKIWVILSISLLFDIPSMSPNSVTRHRCRSLEKSHMGFPDRCTVNVCPDRLSFKVLEFFRWILHIPIDIPRLHRRPGSNSKTLEPLLPRPFRWIFHHHFWAVFFWDLSGRWHHYEEPLNQPFANRLDIGFCDVRFMVDLNRPQRFRHHSSTGFDGMLLHSVITIPKWSQFFG